MTIGKSRNSCATSSIKEYCLTPLVRKILNAAKNTFKNYDWLPPIMGKIARYRKAMYCPAYAGRRAVRARGPEPKPKDRGGLRPQAINNLEVA